MIVRKDLEAVGTSSFLAQQQKIVSTDGKCEIIDFNNAGFSFTQCSRNRKLSSRASIFRICVLQGMTVQIEKHEPCIHLDAGHVFNCLATE